MTRVLFVQVSEPGAYPPLLHAANLLAEAGVDVTFLSAPIQGSSMRLSPSLRIAVVALPERPSYIVSRLAFLRYCARAVTLARKLKPHFVYASDPLGALPGWLAAIASGAKLIYHEHDSPNSSDSLNRVLRWGRSAALRCAALVVFPSAERAEIVQQQTGYEVDKLRVVWNLPRLAELPRLPSKAAAPFVLYYHGSINPERLPEAVVEAVASFGGAVRLDVVGYEAPSAKGYIAGLLIRWNDGVTESIRFLGSHPRAELLGLASHRHVGLAFMPLESADINMRHMVGASNKAFDYMAAGLPLLVSDIPGWKTVFVDAGYADYCDPSSVISIRNAIGRLLADNGRMADMSSRCRAKIERDWNYDVQFKDILRFIVRP